MKISIIVPIYNVEKYLRRCLDSLINQTYKDIEIILVDDGSTDNSANICREYMVRDNRIVFIHKENGGLPSARNKGLEHANGDFIGFIDSDDYVALDMYQYLMDIYEETNADIICCGVSRIFTKSGKSFNTLYNDKVMVYDTEEALYKFQLSDNITPAVWNKIFNKQIIQNIYFENYRRLEDARFVCKAVLQAKNVAFGCEMKYMYEVRNGSVTRSGFNEKSYDILKVTDDNYTDILSVKPVKYNPIIGRIFWYTVFINEMIMRHGSDKKVIKETQDMINTNWKEIAANNDFNKIRKLQYWMLSRNFEVYSLFYKFYCGLCGK